MSIGKKIPTGNEIPRRNGSLPSDSFSNRPQDNSSLLVIEDIAKHILSLLRIKDLSSAARVNKAYSHWCSELLIARINLNQLRIQDVFNGKKTIASEPSIWERMADCPIGRGLNSLLNLNRIRPVPYKSAPQIIAWLAKSKCSQYLEHADFSEFQDFDSACLEKLAHICPNLKYLSLRGTNIQGYALKYLQNNPKLRCLDVTACPELEHDAPKHLAQMLKYSQGARRLISVHIIGCGRFKSAPFRHLQETSPVFSLNITGYNSFEPDALQHFCQTPEYIV